MNNNNLTLAIVLSVLILVGFQYFYVKPQQEQYRERALAQKLAHETPAKPDVSPASPAAPDMTFRERADILQDSPRLAVSTPELSGSINLKGGRIDDLSLTQYRESVDPRAAEVVLLSPSGSKPPHIATYAEFSWLASDPAQPTPSAQTLWKADGKTLSPGHPVTLSWNNGKGLRFERAIEVDEHFMFTLTDKVTSAAQSPVTLYPFGLVARHGLPSLADSHVIHEGPLGVLDGTLEEFSYEKLAKRGKTAAESRGGWLGIADKYWLVAIIPPADEPIAGEFVYQGEPGAHLAQGRYQSDFRGAALTLAPGESVQHVTRLFAGAKRVRLLDQYADAYHIPHFDRAIDFGWFYFLTKPFLYLLDWLGGALGSLGIAILLFTVALKLITLPLSLKSYHSMARMKALQPEIKRIQERFGDDKVRQNQETMELFKREKVNPTSGCVPTLIQIPIFFALYKVLYVSIEMRQAPFYGWIRDMSMPDPTSVFTLLGLIPWTPPAMLQLGVWPILMGLSMFLQQKLSPQPMDKSQARMFMFMPLLFTFMLAHMPSGLVIYWTWSNLLSIAQQWFIMRKDLKGKA